MSDSGAQPPKGWQQPDAAHNKRRQWFTPENALTEEQLAALRDDVQIAPLQSALDDIPAAPQRPGGWHNAEGSSYDIKPARELGELIHAATTDAPNFDEDSKQTADSDFEAVDNAPVVEVDEQEAAFRQSPQLLGDAPQGIQSTPELPLSAQLNPGLGGLRDEERQQALDAADEGLTFEEIAAMREDAVQSTIDLPSRGGGGVSDEDAIDFSPAIDMPAQGFGGVHDEASTSPQDTGPIQVPVTNQAQAEQPAPAASSAAANANQQQAGNQPMNPQNQQPSVAERFREVEQSVQALRQQFAQGQITRNQLENELRRLMVLDDQGRWWTLGVDSKRWYRYDGREWVPDTPPQTSSQPAVSPQQQSAAAMNVPTETGVQPAAGQPAPSGTSPQARWSYPSNRTR